MDGKMLSEEHIPVLAEPLIEKLILPADAVIVDSTIGHGGHSLLLGSRLGPKGRIIGLDVDPDSIAKARQVLGGLECRVDLYRENFSRIDRVMELAQAEKADLVLADVGFCSAQLENIERGLSFEQNMPLDMRLDQRLELTAADILKSEDENVLADIIYRYGEERASRRIAKLIVEQRKNKPITTTAELAAIVVRAKGLNMRWVKSRSKEIAQTFQALRIAVNHELDVLEELLDKIPSRLKTGGFAAVITFHSLEARIVKQNFRRLENAGVYEALTKKPITASQDECRRNPRSRSAQMRIVRKKM
jgi:16S rRNA (cytosine1402-N4)-methyltransferase